MQPGLRPSALVGSHPNKLEAASLMSQGGTCLILSDATVTCESIIPFSSILRSPREGTTSSSSFHHAQSLAHPSPLSPRMFSFPSTDSLADKSTVVLGSWAGEETVKWGVFLAFPV